MNFSIEYEATNKKGKSTWAIAGYRDTKPEARTLRTETKKLFPEQRVRIYNRVTERVVK